jgi:hypothetical protein
MEIHTWKTTSPRSPSAPQVADGKAGVVVVLAEVGALVVVELAAGLVAGAVGTVGETSEDVVAPLRGKELDAVNPGEETLVGRALAVPFCTGVLEESEETSAVEIGHEDGDAMVEMIGEGLAVVGDVVVRGTAVPYIGAGFP